MALAVALVVVEIVARVKWLVRPPIEGPYLDAVCLHDFNCENVCLLFLHDSSQSKT